MSTKITLLLCLLVILLAALASLVVYNRLPLVMASHWSANDQVNGTMPRFWGAFLMPLLALVMLGLFLLIPGIDPLKANIAKFRGFFNAFILLIMVFLLFIHLLSLAWNLGYQDFKMSMVILPAVGLLFVFSGVLIMRAKRNFFIGIRTPWTLSSDQVWDKTHRLGGWLFIGMGLITVLSALLGAAAMWVLLVVLPIVVLVPTIYSYLLYQQENHA